MTTNQQGDVLLLQTADGGDIVESNGFTEMTTGLETAVILSLCGGNAADNVSDATSSLQWWGNDGEPVERQYRSEFHSLLTGRPITSGLISELRDAAQRDIDRDIVGQGFAESAEILIRISGQKSVELRITLLINGQNPVIVTLEASQ